MRPELANFRLPVQACGFLWRMTAVTTHAQSQAVLSAESAGIARLR
jgi:hypothetical protein